MSTGIMFPPEQGKALRMTLWLGNCFHVGKSNSMPRKDSRVSFGLHDNFRLGRA